MPTQTKRDIAGDLLLPISALLFVAASIFYFSARGTAVASPGLVSSLTERNAAMAEAQKNGQTEYRYETRFTPGVGFPASSQNTTK